MNDEMMVDGNEPYCPYCGRTTGCAHRLLVVDLTFREASAGILYEAFTARWNEMHNVVNA